MRPHILLLTTGGTIASLPTAEGLAPGLDGEALAGLLPQGIMDCYDITIRDILHLDSSNIQPEEWQTIARHVFENRMEYSGIVITHGTDTMAYTASVLSFMLRGISIPVVLTGGQGYGEEITEAACMYDYLTARGVEPERLILEEAASNTAENFEFSAPLLEAAGVRVATDTVAVVTNDFHIARSRLIAAKKGYGVTVGVGAPIPWPHLEVNYYLREAFAVVKSVLFD